MVKVNGQIVESQKFPNNETKVKDFGFFKNGEINDVELKFESDADFMKLLFVKREIDNAADKIAPRADLFIHYMPYSRMDRKIEGDIYTLQHVTRFISNLGFNRICVMEPHSAKTMELFKSFGCCVRDIYPTKKWVGEIMQEQNFTPNDHVVYPDKGARARYADMITGGGANGIITFDKTRDPQSGKIKGIDIATGVVNKHSKCIIHDDLCSKGGTFLGAADKLKTAGADNVSLLVAHCEDTIFDGELLKPTSPIDKIYTSDSIITRDHDKIKKFIHKQGGQYERQQ
jgi:ribose-phosphate pyrophosphokinase